jgi:hypothetical protein
MKSKAYLSLFAAFTGFFLLTGLGFAYGSIYTYKCPKCGLVQQYDHPSPGIKCPNDGWVMIPKY